MMSSAFPIFILEARIVRREPVTAIRSIDQEQRFTVARLQAINDLFWQHHPERVSEFADFEFDHESPPASRRIPSTLLLPTQEGGTGRVIILVIVGRWVLA